MSYNDDKMNHDNQSSFNSTNELNPVNPETNLQPENNNPKSKKKIHINNGYPSSYCRWFSILLIYKQQQEAY